MRDLPDVPSLSLGTGLVTPLRSDRGVCGVSQRRPRGPGRAALTRVHRCGRRRRVRQSRARRSRDLRAGRLPDGVDASRTSMDRGTASAGAHRRSACRFPVGRQDWHDRRLQGCLVRGIQLVGRRRGLGRARSAGDDRPRGIRRALRAADLERVHARRGARTRRARDFDPAVGLRQELLCKRVVLAARSRSARPTRSTSRRVTRSRRGSVRSTRGV